MTGSSSSPDIAMVSAVFEYLNDNHRGWSMDTPANAVWLIGAAFEVRRRASLHPATDAAATPRDCTCHPDDNPPRPCPQRFAYSECVAAATPLMQAAQKAQQVVDGWSDAKREYADRITGVAQPSAKPVGRQWIVDLIRQQFDPKPSDWKASDTGWDDGAEFIADAILAQLPLLRWEGSPIPSTEGK